MMENKWGFFPERKTGDPIPGNVKSLPREKLMELCRKMWPGLKPPRRRVGFVEGMPSDATAFLFARFKKRGDGRYRTACLVSWGVDFRWFTLDVGHEDFFLLEDAEILALRSVVSSLLGYVESGLTPDVALEVGKFIKDEKSGFREAAVACRVIFVQAPER
ncbi:hypothetical protein [Nocardiopsis sp. CA-288880]|uniref:hypothetical protein n=1 Tax=Nocardiopsis sp. CA-288880 TaxID=3239995 RepID=UPI003D97F49E